ncbi:hypothetical protein DUI87_30305 [Hirundo rustica rustica]|uniref:Uncharacterized protein n=1 Tax=Hirundo rustica rustica TaxID=333673 RepID=A0A3M0IYC4_HIRRU|nr:hypothetical protein DUI87_30305 [Hirundo rustica rustica]
MELSIWRRISPEKLEGSCLSGGKTLSKFLGKNREQLPSWGENPDWISVKNWNGFSRLGGKPGLDFCQKLEWIVLVGGKTRTGFNLKTGMESPGWRENPDWISGKNWNGFSWLDGKPGPDFCQNWNGFSWLDGKPGLAFCQKLEWSHLVGGKPGLDYPWKTGMESPGWRENPDWISGKNWNGFAWLERNLDWITPGKLEWCLPVGWKTRTGFPPENRNGVTQLVGKQHHSLAGKYIPMVCSPPRPGCSSCNQGPLALHLPLNHSLLQVRTWSSMGTTPTCCAWISESP